MSAPLTLYSKPASTPTPSVFDTKTLADILEDVRAIYRADARPWVLGFSGGKDSTASLQLVWYALAGLTESERTKPVYVIASDTLVETPVIVDRIDGALDAIAQRAAEAQLPISANKVRPTVEDSFWVSLIGKGYPAPSRRFRWCTDRLKIKPANAFILNKVAEFGEVVMVLGVRSAESATRAQVMSFHRKEGSRLARHSELPNAYVFAPIEDWSTDDVWTYLLQVPNPWGQDNRDLLALYSSANAGECPLVIDKTTPSCGNSRFGCWVCTVVERDRSMEALVDSGEEWLLPLLEFRDLLAETQNPERKFEFRDVQRRDGGIKRKADGTPTPGPYKFEFSKKILRQLLEMQRDIQTARGEAFSIITDDELHEIRRVWRTERQDWDDSVPAIYREVTGRDLDWVTDDAGQFSGADRELLDEISSEFDVSPRMLAKLLDLERSLAGLGRRSRIFTQIDAILGHEWRSLDELQAAGPLFANAADLDDGEGLL